MKSKATRIFLVKGVVKEVDAPNKKVKIAHEQIPGYMEAMTMSFDVKEAREVADLKPGDKVSFRMLVTENDGWVDEIRRLGSEPTSAAPPVQEGSFRRVRSVEPLAIGDPLPDYRFTNEVGRAVQLADFKGKAFALTFIFTRCPFPTFCPRMTGNFEEVAKQLAARSDAPDNWRLLSLTIDPAHDGPEQLKEYAKNHGYQPDRWSYLTGEWIDITAIGEQFGLEFWRDANTVNHNLRTVVVDANSRVQKIIKGNEWKPEELVEELVKAARP